MTESLRVKMTRAEKQVIALASSAHGLNHGLELTYAAVLSSIALTFQVDLWLLGIIANLSALAYGALALPSGILADRLGSKRMVKLSLLAGGGCALLVAVAPNAPLLALALVLMGLGAGLYHPAGLAFITRGVHKRTMGLGFHGVAGNLGVAITPAIAAALAGSFSWRWAFVVIGLLCILLSAVVHLSTVAEQVQTAPGTSRPRMKLSDTWREYRPMLPPLLAILSINVFGGIIYRGAITFLPLHIETEAAVELFGIDHVTLAGSFTTGALLFGALGQLLGGYLGERIQREKLVAVLAFLLMPSLLLLGLSDGLLIVVGAALFALFNFMAQPVYNTLVADYTPVHLRGTSYGLAFLATFGLGSLGGTLSGYIAERSGTSEVFIVLAGFSLLVWVITLYLFITRRGGSKR